MQCHTVFQKNVKSMHTSLTQEKGKTDYNILPQLMVYVFNSYTFSAGPADSVLWPQHKEWQAIQSSSRLVMIMQSCTAFYYSHGAGTVSSHLHFFFFAETASSYYQYTTMNGVFKAMSAEMKFIWMFIWLLFLYSRQLEPENELKIINQKMKLPQLSTSLLI